LTPRRGEATVSLVLDIPRLDRIRLEARPRWQRVVARGVLLPNYELLRKVEITFEGFEKVPREPVIFAMNHTDRYNYWPFQYHLWRHESRFTATWVKGKYYENPIVGKFMEMTNNLPTVSRGYIITKDLLANLGRRPTDDEYGALRHHVDAIATGEPADERTLPVPRAFLTTPRNILGRDFDPTRETWGEAIVATFSRMMQRFLQLHEEAFAIGLDLLVFPQGTRSIRLSRGHIGMSQVALRYGKTVVAVGCSGSDRVYPTSSPFAKPGRIVYRFGEPLTHDDAAAWHVPEPFTPFDAKSEKKHRALFQSHVDEIMRRIDGLVDEPYRFAPDATSDGVKGSHRFV
jgi:1-acyl-sn-glycerol-3-phosphate acyltransferase